ncbi:MAG TPA: ParB/RepB/Spo0J family partition protein, partial [Acidobacteriaceae bacterium]|nr:ParB/RepB/Spo0J family partition protein [Acidobacteriaceae bacterium]
MSRNEGKNPAKVEPPKRRALGKGLESLLSTPAPPEVVAQSRAYVAARLASTSAHHTVDDPYEAHVGGTPREIPTDQIDPNPYQTRMQVDEQKLDELARSITANGVVQPIIVRPQPDGRFQLIAGERRWRASMKAGKETVPAILRQVSDEQAMEMTIVENLQRADLNPMEQARAYDRLSRDFHMTQEQVAQRTGKDRATVANFLRLLRLPVPVQGKVESGDLTFGHARALLSLDGAEEILKAMNKVVALSMSVRQTETYIQGLMDPERKRK